MIAFEFDNKNIGIVFPDLFYKVSIPKEKKLFLKTFTKTGAAKFEKALVYRADVDFPDDPIMAAGALPLPEGGALIGFTENAPGVSGLYARKAKKGQVVGDRLDIRTRDDQPISSSFLIQLSKGAIAISQFGYYRPGKKRTMCQSISESGEINPAAIDITRSKRKVTGARKYLDGVIVHFAGRSEREDATTSAQIFGPDCVKIGPELVFPARIEERRIRDTQVIGLSDGKIAAVHTVEKAGGYEVRAEIFSKDLSSEIPQAVIAETPYDDLIGVEAVADGGFLVGVTIPDDRGFADGLEIKCFDQMLKRNGAPVKITGVNSPRIQQFLARGAGDVLMTYTWYSPDSSKMNFSGQFIKP